MPVALFKNTNPTNQPTNPHLVHQPCQNAMNLEHPKTETKQPSDAYALDDRQLWWVYIHPKPSRYANFEPQLHLHFAAQVGRIFLGR